MCVAEAGGRRASVGVMTMRHFGTHWLKVGIAQEMRRVALVSRIYNGTTPIDPRCKALHIPTGTLLIFTRDAGMHSGGWWKNPDYERCWHLSLSFHDPITGESAPKNTKLTDEWLDAFYGDDQRYLWAESPYSLEGKRRGVWHYRLFCDPSWAPILPRGEVYSKEFTERGWMSFSELKNVHHRALVAPEAGPGEQ